MQMLTPKYELIRLAGEGGMAQVFESATLGAQGFRRPVAIKLIHEHLSSDPHFVGLFVEEARVNASLRHPNIVQIHDFDQVENGRFFLVMEWVDGITLREWLSAHLLERKLPPWHLVAASGIEILKALSAAHENLDPTGAPRAVFHRDVTPQNILMGSNGIVQLTDFGLARAMDRARFTRPNVVKGKLRYLAPELTQGEDPSAQTDVFSLGVVLWQTLTGRQLFDAQAPANILDQVRTQPIPVLGEYRGDCPEGLQRVLDRALARSKKDRFPSARAMIRALANLLRVTPESTSAEVLAKSVERSRDILFEESLRASEEVAAIPLSGAKRMTIELDDDVFEEVSESDFRDPGSW